MTCSKRPWRPRPRRSRPARRGLPAASDEPPDEDAGCLRRCGPPAGRPPDHPAPSAPSGPGRGHPGAVGSRSSGGIAVADVRRALAAPRTPCAPVPRQYRPSSCPSPRPARRRAVRLFDEGRGRAPSSPCGADQALLPAAFPHRRGVLSGRAHRALRGAARRRFARGTGRRSASSRPRCESSGALAPVDVHQPGADHAFRGRAPRPAGPAPQSVRGGAGVRRSRSPARWPRRLPSELWVFRRRLAGDVHVRAGR